MGMETVLFKSEERKTRREVATALRQIADKVESGVLTLQQGHETVELAFPEALTLEMKVEEEQGRQTKRSLEIELEWIPGAEPAGETKIL